MTDAFSMDRRELIGRLAFLIGASALPVDVLAATAKRKPAHFLAPASYTLLVAVADTLIPATDTPGALAAKVPEHFDGMLAHWASAETRANISSALAAIDQAALAQEKKPFVALSAERRKTVLSAHDLAALKTVPRKDKLIGLAAMMAGPAVVDPGYSRLKETLVNLYYASEIGLTQELVYEHVPGKWVPSLMITPQTRPFAGPSMF